MLSAPSKNRRRRRRRRKQSISNAGAAAAAASSSNHEADESPPNERQQMHHTLQPKVTSEFLNEEAAIETAMLVKHFNKDTELERQRERAIEFFTSNIEWNECEAPAVDTDADDEIQANKDEATDVVAIPSSVRTTAYPDDGPQLASSYLHEGVENVIEPFGRQTITFDAHELFVPPLTMPKQWNAADDDVERAGAHVRHRNLVDEGHFVLANPSISSKNRAQFINRLLVSDEHQWLDEAKHDLAGLQNFIENSKLFKSECVREFQALFFEPTTALTATDSYALQNKILKLKINDILFDRHPLFNSEQKIARELVKLYEDYRARKSANLTGSIQTKLDVMRQHIKSASLPKSSRTNTRSKTIADDIERFRIYRDELRDLRNRVHREMKIDRDIVAAILGKWAELKKERESHTATTAVRLIIHAQETDAERDAIEWSARFNLEFNEIFNEAMDFYREERRRQKQRMRDGALDDIEAAATFESIAKIHRPDAEQIRQQLYDIFANTVRPPGEQLIDIDLIYDELRDASATTKDRPKYIVRLLFDEKELDAVASSNLNKAGQVYVNASFCVKFITKIPEKLEIQIYEKYHLKVERRIAQIFLPIPYEDEIYANTSALSICFACETNTHAGTISCQIGWNETPSIDLSTATAIATSSSTSSARAHSAADTKMRSTIEKWYAEQLIDPMDPENGTMAPIIAELATSTPRVQRHSAAQAVGASQSADDVNETDLFRLNEDVHTFCASDKFNANKRLELLIARFNSDLKLKDCRLVPHTEIEIEVPTDLNIFEDMLWIDPIDVQRYQGKKYLKHVYDIITNHCTVINRNYEHHDLLIGDTPPTLNGALEALTNIFSPRRPLNPTRRTSNSAVRRTNLNDSDRINRFNIVLNVVRASNIPYRSRSERGNNERRHSLASSVQNFHRQANVRPFVTATFKQKTLRTSTVDGSSPTWNEQIVIPINEDINQIKDSLWFHMYDEMIEDIPSNDELMIPATEIYQKISSHYLGELVIPFSTIFASQRIEGTFEMTTPVILFGYTKPSVSLKEHMVDVSAGAIEVRRSILISLLISIEPIIEIVQFSTSHLECIELTRVKNHIASWLSDVREEFPHRAKDPLVCLASGKRVCITRLIGPIDIPFERNDVAEYLIRRFVSLIPVRPHKNVCTKLNGVWLTNDQMLNILIASPKDLGVLLTCYYLSLGFAAYLVLGFAIPYGDTTFVLTKENGEYYLIDPHSGKKCSSRDTFCALTKVYCIVAADNVWANIQRENRVFMQTFDTTQSMEWRPLFTKSMPAPNDLMHDLTLDYTDSLDASGLRKSIETKLMRKISVWRTNARKTVWNKRYREQLMQVLENLEEDRCFEYEQKSYTDKLGTDLLAKYKVSGYPLNMPYVSIARIIERVKATGIHFNSDQKVEFALAVHIQSYPMNIFSVWIFLLALTPH